MLAWRAVHARPEKSRLSPDRCMHDVNAKRAASLVGESTKCGAPQYEVLACRFGAGPTNEGRPNPAPSASGALCCHPTSAVTPREWLHVDMSAIRRGEKRWEEEEAGSKIPSFHPPKQRHELVAQCSHAHAAMAGRLWASLGNPLCRLGHKMAPSPPESGSSVSFLQTKPNTLANSVLSSTLVLLIQDALACSCPCCWGGRVSRQYTALCLFRIWYH